MLPTAADHFLPENQQVTGSPEGFVKQANSVFLLAPTTYATATSFYGDYCEKAK